MYHAARPTSIWAEIYKAREAEGLGAVGLGDAMANEMVNAAQRASAAAWTAYAQLVSVDQSGAPSSKLSISATDTAISSGQVAQMQQYNQQMNQATGAFLSAAQLAWDAISYVASSNWSAAPYVQAATQDWTLAQGYATAIRQAESGSIPWSGAPSNWSNEGNSYSSNGLTTSITSTIDPAVNWLEQTLALANVCTQAVQFAQTALAMPAPAPPQRMTGPVRMPPGTVQHHVVQPKAPPGTVPHHAVGPAPAPTPAPARRLLGNRQA